MTEHTFDALVQARAEMIRDHLGDYVPANVFVPWAGEMLASSGRGIYFIGIAIAGENPYGEQTFAYRRACTENWCTTNRGKDKFFWPFINRLTTELLGAPYYECYDRWGWSNLLKIAGREGEVRRWPKSLKQRQSAACKRALAEELSGLRDSLIVITSSHLYDSLPDGIMADPDWDTNDDRPGGTYLLHQRATGNSFAHCNHPRYRRKGIDKEALRVIVDYTRQTLPPF